MFKRDFSQVENLKPILPGHIKFRVTSSLHLRTRHNLDALWVNSEGGMGGGGGLAGTFDLAAFLVSMIVPLKKSVNHLRTIASIHKLQITQMNPNMFLCHFCSVLAFKSIPVIFFIHFSSFKQQLCNN